MKPDWNEAPEWAQYVAMDQNGEWWWYEDEPSQGFAVWRDSGGMVDRCNLYHPDNGWNKSLQKRPEA